MKSLSNPAHAKLGFNTITVENSNNPCFHISANQIDAII